MNQKYDAAPLERRVGRLTGTEKLTMNSKKKSLNFDLFEVEETINPIIDINILYHELKPFFEKWEKFIHEYNYLWAEKNFIYWKSRLIDDYPTHTKYQKENTNKLKFFPDIFGKYLEEKKAHNDRVEGRGGDD